MGPGFCEFALLQCQMRSGAMPKRQSPSAPSGRELSAKLTEGVSRTDSLYKPESVLCGIELLAILPQSPPGGGASSLPEGAKGLLHV